ncbi:hypothetical protein FE257_008978 [Aspergillus nanangensis]|uniref:Uncharacterized protein n=1 Tax=Aspergillus nanangensis TaxID=2582783 RepID=A0AAD4CWZ6_ASPNN|nr:hypothetical protein FE257_008978 [Aspergillus nanangensis]
MRKSIATLDNLTVEDGAKGVPHFQNAIYSMAEALEVGAAKTQGKTISCFAVDNGESLPHADIRLTFLIELVMVTSSWEILVPTAHGDVPLDQIGQGQRTRVYIEGDELKRKDQEELDPLLQNHTILQAIRYSPQIGRTWVVQ